MRTNIKYSFDFAWNALTHFIAEQPFLFIIIAIVFIWSLISHRIKSFLKNKYISPYEWSGNTENRGFYINYYKKVQYVDIFGVILVLVLFFVYLLTKDKIIGTVLAVGVGAILITFQTFTISFFTYFLLIKNYKVGDTIRVAADKFQGEILYIKILYIGISGKNDFGENTGEFYIIPNNQIWMHPITKIDLSLDNMTKHSLTIMYDSAIFSLSFDSFVSTLQVFLDQLLPLIPASDASYFKSYIGVKYKIDFSCEKDAKASIWIGFIAKRAEGVTLKKEILSFVETQKKMDSD